MKKQDAIEEIFDEAKAMDLIGQRLESFYAFTERFLGPARGWKRARPWRVDVCERGGVEVAVLQLSSAWTSGTDDEKGLLVGLSQARLALEEAADANLRIVLVHHPLDDLRAFDRTPLRALLGSGDVHFLLRGHLHRTETSQLVSPDGSFVELAAGAAYTSDRWPRRHLLSEVDFAAGEARVHLFRYSDEGKGFWARDTLAYENVPDGLWTLPLDRTLRLDTETPAPAVLTDARRATLTARYRTAAAAVHGSVRFVGFADHRPRPNVGVPELFVPLRFEVDQATLPLPPEALSPAEPVDLEKTVDRGRGPAGSGLGEGSPQATSWTTSHLLQHLAANDAPGRVVVLGDPGSGKTTLTRFLTVAVAGEASQDDVEVPEDVLPLFLPFREYVRECREKDDVSLADFLLKSADVQLQLPITKPFLEKALEEGRAVLLLDGLDEVGSAADREEMRERVQGFCRLYPKVGALVTSRVSGYTDAPLPGTGSDAFVHLKLVPFDDDDLRRFVTHWYAVQEPTDPLARDRGVADLMAAIEADVHVRELARNPLLATLIALVHRYEAHLPGERAALYDLCVKTLLETWPSARRTTFAEIDAGLQRVYLETLAYRMQRSRSKKDRDVTIERGPLVEGLVEIVREREGQSASPEKTRGLVERWVQFLEKGSGLLVEQRPGVFAFFHLSLMEYLAARGMDEAEVAEELIAERFNDPTWREVCLLAVGSKATEKPFLDRLFDKLGGEKGGWSFLLRCLREEAAFDEEQRAAIVLGAGRDLLSLEPWEWQADQQTLGEVLRFSFRHAEWGASWLRHRLGSERAESLRGLVALRLEDKEILDGLARRTDAAESAADLLEYWPGTPVGEQAARIVSAPAAFDWGRTSPADLLPLRALAVDDGIARPAAGLLVGLLRTTGAHASMAHDAAAALAERERPEGRGLPTTLGLEPVGNRLAVLPILSSRIVHVTDYDFSRDFSLVFSSEGKALAAPATPQTSPDLNAWAEARQATDEESFLRHFTRAFSRYAGETWIGLAATAGRPEDERRAYMNRRVQNAWLLHVWPAVDRRFAGTSVPERQALYLALGFSQASTTWQWPYSERWKELLGGPPPPHWLPRSMWHLCWRLYTSNLPEGTGDDEVHRQGLDEALDEGLADAERPGVASALRELIVT